MTVGFCFDFDGTITDRELLPYLAEAVDLADTSRPLKELPRAAS